MTPALRKLNLTAHITFSVGWIGALAVFLALAIAGLASQDAQMVRVAYPAMELTARFVIVPLALASLLSGLIQSLGTPWGLFRHYWVLAKLLLTMFATIVLLVKMPLIGYAARQAAVATLLGSNLRVMGMQLGVHAAGGLLVLLVVTTLSVYKPWGLTYYGRRNRQQARRGKLGTLMPTPSTLPDSVNETTGGHIHVGLKILLVAVGVTGAILVMLHHLTSDGLGSHGH